MVTPSESHILQLQPGLGAGLGEPTATATDANA
jgi:hypothetical protein